MKNFRNKYLEDKQGATAVETALVLPFVAAFLFGILQVSLVFYDLSMTQNSLEQAARDILILADPTDADVVAAATAAMYQPRTASVVLTTSFVNQYGADYAQLDAAFSYAVQVPFTNGISVNRTLGTEVVLRR